MVPDGWGTPSMPRGDAPRLRGNFRMPWADGPPGRTGAAHRASSGTPPPDDGRTGGAWWPASGDDLTRDDGPFGLPPTLAGGRTSARQWAATSPGIALRPGVLLVAPAPKVRT